MRRVLTHAAVAVLLVGAMGAAPARRAAARRHSHPKPKPAAVAAAGEPKAYQIGVATWYGRRSHGRRTASGERFNMHHFTAAHRMLPIGTLVRVTNLKTRRWVIVRINDRGPLRGRGRVIDLSYSAGMALGMRGVGVCNVRLDVLTPEQQKEPVYMAALHRQERVEAGEINPDLAASGAE